MKYPPILIQAVNNALKETEERELNELNEEQNNWYQSLDADLEAIRLFLEQE